VLNSTRLRNGDRWRSTLRSPSVMKKCSFWRKEKPRIQITQKKENIEEEKSKEYLRAGARQYPEVGKKDRLANHNSASPGLHCADSHLSCFPNRSLLIVCFHPHYRRNNYKLFAALCLGLLSSLIAHRGTDHSTQVSGYLPTTCRSQPWL